ncbi:SGNH/GDSL hydrolase family protein [Flavobacterium wongokense]|uniref:SGNH/GDSL hydrolase family protein n=1 Tax=Flavobacterium wongokense TaxID=2910674 RepID=UPI001F26332E|nr:SGNH/GDSL hydrolase family protein [Flavobacterium sp. WG47]MCF6131743.1 SGNH/GDSL hydrolase family protein [Flavobacterium sp. WG47]
MIKNFKWLLLVSLTFVACDSSDDAVTDPNSIDGSPLTAGSADFSKYVALGDSFAAGYSDGALFKTGQENAYPNILATQFALVGGGDFATPFMIDNIGGFSSGGAQVPGFSTRLVFNPATSTPAPISGISGTDISAHLSGSFNNYGIPGAKSYHLLFDGYAAANPYFGRFASSSSATVIGDALAQSPTFFSLWIGGNDELGYATAGGDTALNPLTPANVFQQSYGMLISQLTAGGRKGVIANLPYVTTLPYFHVIQYNQLTQANLTVGGVNQVNALNAQLYGPLHNALAFLGQGSRINLLSTSGNNPMIMVDETLTDVSTSLTAVLIGSGLDVPTATALGQIFGRARQTVPTDLICLSASSRIGQVPSVALDGVASPTPLLSQLGVTFPLPDRYILIPTEVTEIQAATDSYNAVIEGVAADASLNLAFVNAKDIMNQLTGPTGVVMSGYTMTATYVTGNTFSLDGIHPSPRGYAMIANKFLEAINTKYGSNFKGVNLGQYQILYPSGL